MTNIYLLMINQDLQKKKTPSELQSDPVLKQETIFDQKYWTKAIPSKFVIQTEFVDLKMKDVRFLIDDQTNPNYSNFEAKHEIEQAIAALGGKAFLKIANRTAKDSSVLMNIITSVQSLVLLIKMSEYLTEAIDEHLDQTLQEQQKILYLVLRRYIDALQVQQNQFRVYIKNKKIVGICQKHTNFIGSMPSFIQLTSIKSVITQINSSLNETHKPLTYVLDLYCSANGQDVLILAIQPFLIHSLSLFTLEDLEKHYEKMQASNAIQPLIKVVENEKQMKQIDLNQYKMGKQLTNQKNVEEWINFMKNAQFHNEQ